MATFNVIHNPWIPVEELDGKIHEYGILEILERAHTLRTISDSSPLFEYGIYRLIIAFLTDALRPKSIDDLKRIYSNGKFPIELINQYICDCEKEGACFDLFDKDKPFLQSAWNDELDHKFIRSIALLVHDLPSGNNSIHYDHRLQETQALSPQVCVRALCAVNVFCTSGRQGPSGINGAPPWYVLVGGRSLFERLVFNIWIPDTQLSFDDPPIAWRNADPVLPGKSANITSYLYGLTWQSRRICLIPEEKGGYCSYSGRYSPVLVRTMAFQQGWKFEGHNLWRDPHTLRKKSEDGIFSMKPREGRTAWSEIGPLILLYGDQFDDYQYYCPEVVHQYIRSICSTDDSHGLLEVKAYGLVTNQSKNISWIREKLLINIKLVKNENLAMLLRNELANIEKIAIVINSALNMASASLSIILNAKYIFLNSVQTVFLEYLQCSLANAETQVERWHIPILKQWHIHLKTISLNVIEDSLGKLGNSSRMIEKASRARKYYSSRIKQLLQSYEGDIICMKS